MRSIPAVAVTFVERHEGLRLESYQDPGGVWTIGYGHTGPAIHAGLRWTRERCKTALEDDLSVAASRLAAVVSSDVLHDLTEGQYAALLSFVFNLGVNPRWRIWRVLNARQFDVVPAELQRFVFVGKAKVAGLVRRRAAEAALWNEDGTEGDLPSSYTRQETTPPVEVGKPLARSRTFWGAATVAAASAPEAIKAASGGVSQVTGAVQPFAGKSKMVDTALDSLATVGAGLAFLLVLFLWAKKRGWV